MCNVSSIRLLLLLLGHDRVFLSFRMLVLYHSSKEHLTLSATLFGRVKLGKTGFQIEVSDLIELITEDKLRHASRHPLHLYPQAGFEPGSDEKEP